MEALVPLLLLACPIGMGLMMWFMMRGGEKHQQSQDASVPDLKAEQARLAERIATLEQQGAGKPEKVDVTAQQATPAAVR